MKATEIGAFEAKTKFSELLEKVARGQEFLITHRGKPVARLISGERPATRGKGPTPWEIYQKIQKSGPRLSRRKVAEAVRSTRRELVKRTDRLLT